MVNAGVSESFTHPLVHKKEQPSAPVPAFDMDLPSLTLRELKEPSCSYCEQVTRAHHCE